MEAGRRLKREASEGGPRRARAGGKRSAQGKLHMEEHSQQVGTSGATSASKDGGGGQKGSRGPVHSRPAP